jgi:general stress protein YciG
MPGTQIGGIKAAVANKERYGEGFYGMIGAIGGSHSHTGGFYANRELAREAGRKGGMKSKRGTVFVDYQGKKVPLMQLVTNNISYETLRSRIIYQGWSVERAITTPLGRWTKRDNRKLEQ